MAGKKWLRLTIYVMALGESSICFAGMNPYADVSRDSQDYMAVKALIAEGLVSGCTVEDFQNSKRMTRYDLSVYIAQAMSRMDEADKSTQADIMKLARNYSHELRVIGVVDESISELGTVQQNPKEKPEIVKKLEKLQVNGSGRLRYDGGYSSGPTMSRGTEKGTYSPNDHVNVDLVYSYQLNDNWKLWGESEWGHNLNNQTHSQNLQNSLFSKMFLEGDYKGLKIVAGRYGRYTPTGIHYDEKINGLALTLGNKLKATTEFGRVVAADEDSQPAASPYVYQSPQYQALLLEYGASENTKLHLQYSRIGGNVYQYQLPNQHVNYLMAGVESKIDKKLRVEAAVVHSDAKGYPRVDIGVTSDKHTAFLTRLTYKQADFDKVGSFDIFGMYRYSPQLASYSNADDWLRNVKGLRVGFDYVFMKNMSFTGYYTFGRDIDTGARNDTWRTQWNFRI